MHVFMRLSEILPAFLERIFQKMLYNGYMHPKSIFQLTDVVSTSVYGCLKLILEKNIFEFANFV